MIAVGGKAPDFEAATADGGKLKLSSLQGRSVVLYFYPEADTPGCTTESKGFRDEYPQYQAKKVEIVGVSVDPVAKQCDFAEKYHLPFPLIADHPKEVAQQYGVLGPSGKARRVSFLIDPKGTVVEVVDDRSADVHLKRARERFLAA